MLQTKHINYVPAAVGAGLIPLLSDILASDSHNAASQQAVMRCLRLVTETEFGISTVLQQPELRQNIAKMTTKIMSEWCATLKNNGRCSCKSCDRCTTCAGKHIRSRYQQHAHSWLVHCCFRNLTQRSSVSIVDNVHAILIDTDALMLACMTAD
jgi:hypothetical protein